MWHILLDTKRYIHKLGDKRNQQHNKIWCLKLRFLKLKKNKNKIPGGKLKGDKKFAHVLILNAVVFFPFLCREEEDPGVLCLCNL